jgi:hypothetical protein
MSALFKNRAVEAARELAGRKIEYENFISIRLSEIIRDKNLNAGLVTAPHCRVTTTSFGLITLNMI